VLFAIADFDVRAHKEAAKTGRRIDKIDVSRAGSSLRSAPPIKLAR
jgi:hypothetical protein